MRARDLMTRPIVKIDRSADLGRAESLMKQHGIHHLLVYEGRTLAGVLSARDLERAGGYEKLTADDVMTRRVVKANADAPLPRLANLMRGHTIGCLVVTDRGRPVGVITTADLLEVMGRRVVVQTAPKNRPQLSYRTAHRRKPTATGVW